MQTRANMWDGIEDAKLFERGNYMAPGFGGIVELQRTLSKDTEKSGLAFIVEFEIITSNMPDKHPVGSKGTWWQGMTNKPVAFPAVTAFAAACEGFQRHEVQRIKEELSPHLPELMKYLTDNEDDNEYIGKQLRLDTVGTITKEKKVPFTRYDWAPLPA